MPHIFLFHDNFENTISICDCVSSKTLLFLSSLGVILVIIWKYPGFCFFSVRRKSTFFSWLIACRCTKCPIFFLLLGNFENTPGICDLATSKTRFDLPSSCVILPISENYPHFFFKFATEIDTFQLAHRLNMYKNAPHFVCFPEILKTHLVSAI